MNILSQLQIEHSKKNTDEIVAYIGGHQQRFDELIKLFLNGKYIIVQRAAWVLSEAVLKHPHLIKKHYKKVIETLKDNKVAPAVKRNVLRIFDQSNELPAQYHGAIMNICFSFLENPNETIAAQAYSLGIIHKLSKLYPEIIAELKLIIEQRLPNASPAFRSRGLKILKNKY